MSLTSLLDIAKTALITQQTSISTTGHNIANVNTDGYSKQNTISTSRDPVTLDVGTVGTGVSVNDITRTYDRFVTTTLIEKTSIMAGQETRQSGLKIIETMLNEVDEDGLNGMLDNFWASWDDLANVSEGIPERITLLENASIMVQGLSDRYDSLVELSQDVDLEIETDIEDINRISAQIADLNVRILSSEASQHPANDLRDQRDELVKSLSELTDIHFFETERGAYNVITASGNPLVELDKSWNLALIEDEVNWIGQDGSRVVLDKDDISNGTLGGWLDIKDRVTPADTDVISASTINTSGGDAILESTRWEDIDGVVVTGDTFSISISGNRGDGMPLWTYDHTTDPPGTTPPEDVSDVFTYNAGPPEENATVGDFLSFIEDHYPMLDETTGQPMVDEDGNQINRVTAQIDDGRIVIKNTQSEEYEISFQVVEISGAVNGLDLGKFDGDYPLNYLDTLNKFASELIKAVNSQHSQGVGLVPHTEISGDYAVLNSDQPIGYRSSGLAFSDDVDTGYFELWLYDEDGNVVDYDPVTPEVNDPLKIYVQKNSTSLDDIIDAINSAEFSGPPLGDSTGLSARNLEGKLVIQVDGTTNVAGFAFGNDTSGALMALGVNSFFSGTDASNIAINSSLIDDNRLIAAAKTGSRGTEDTSSLSTLRDTERPLGLEVQDGSFTIKIYDKDGNQVDMDPDSPGNDPLSIYVDASSTSVNDILEQINEVDGLIGSVEDGKLEIKIDNDEVTSYPEWEYVTIGDDTSKVLDYLGVDQGHITGTGSVEGRNTVADINLPLSTIQSGLEDYNSVESGNIVIERFHDSAVNTEYVHIDPEIETLESLRSKLDELDGLSASIEPVTIGGETDYRLVLSGTNSADIISIATDETGIMSALGFGIESASIEGNYSVDQLKEPLESFSNGISSGSFNVYIYDEDGYVLSDSLAGSTLNTSSSSPITSATLWQDIDGVSAVNGTTSGDPVDFFIEFTGKDQEGNLISGRYEGNSADSVDDFISFINSSFVNDSPPPASFATASIDGSGRLVINSTVSGKGVGFQVEEIGAIHLDAGDTLSGLNFGTFNGSFNIEINSEYDGLDDVAARIDSLEDMKASVSSDGRIVMETEGRGATFVLADDTTGVGDDPGFLETIGLSTPSGGELSPADNRNALLIRDVNRLTIDNLDDATLSENYQGLIGTIGIDSRGFQMDYEFTKSTVNDLEERRESISGSSLDEELTDLLKFQHAYTAASKLIKAADEMFLTLLQTK